MWALILDLDIKHQEDHFEVPGPEVTLHPHGGIFVTGIVQALT